MGTNRPSTAVRDRQIGLQKKRNGSNLPIGSCTVSILAVQQQPAYQNQAKELFPAKLYFSERRGGG